MKKTFALCSIGALLMTQLSAKSDGMLTLKENPCACLEQGMGLPMEKKCFPAAYNTAASVALSCGWDVDVYASFLYWHVQEDGLSLAITSLGLLQPPGVAFPEFTYKPGFKVGVGCDTNYDDWVTWVEYTWLHQSTSNSVAPPSLVTGLPGRWSLANWDNFLPLGAVGAPVQSSWKMHLDLVDAALSRPFYQGTRLTVSPYVALRALWIRQRIEINMETATVPTRVTNQSRCWSLGPVAGSMAYWLVGKGIRVEGKAAGSLLFTKYTGLAHKELNPVISSTTSVGGNMGNYSCVRPTAELGLGLGWGSYLYCQRYYIDFSARYDFMLLWSQNMLREISNSMINGLGAGIGDLSLQGLTLTGRFDF